jgi:hypothetical protein
VCHAVVSHLRPFVEQKVPDDAIVKAMKRNYCEENLMKIAEIAQPTEVLFVMFRCVSFRIVLAALLCFVLCFFTSSTLLTL